MTGLQLWKCSGVCVRLCVCVCVRARARVLMKWREGLVLQDRGRDALRGSEQSRGLIGFNRACLAHTCLCM